MAFQSSVFRDGEWVTETVNFQDALKASTGAPKTNADPNPEPPACGVLSRTIIESPVVHWILPVWLRSSAHNDVAFIGDRFIQISELRDDGQVHEIIKKSDFGARIRNAVVFGAVPQGKTGRTSTGLVKTEDTDALMEDFPKLCAGDDNHQNPPKLPPQLLVLMLETGQAVFLFVRAKPDGGVEFVTASYECPKNLKFLGFHLSIDPTSRYLAAASAEGAFIVYELESLDTLNTQFKRHGTFQPVKNCRVRPTRGIIHKMEFLHPRPEDDYHIILILIIIRREMNSQTERAHNVSRLVLYDWELGDPIHSVFQKEKIGTRLPDEHRMPLMLIPLRFNAAFFAVSEHHIGIIRNAFEGNTEFDLLRTDTPGQTKLHHGTAEPLWTAWARPFRLDQYFKKTDIVYLAREDGAIIHIEIDSADLLTSVTNVGTINTNISGAFTTAFDVFSDVLIIGGDSGPGGIWKLAARSDPQKVSAIPNWSPVVDLVTTDGNLSWDNNKSATEPSSRRTTQSSTLLRRPDRVFCTSGRGPMSSLTELRWGIQAKIGLEFEYDQPVRQSWIFPTEVQGEKGFYTILSLPHSSEALYFSSGLNDATALSPDASPFDTLSRTVHATQNEDGMIVQITETSINLVTLSQSSRHLHNELFAGEGMIIEHAHSKDDYIIMASSGKQTSILHLLRIEQMKISLVKSWDARGEANCLNVFVALGDHFFAVGSTLDGPMWLTVYSTTGDEVNGFEVQPDTAGAEGHARLETFTSISTVTDDSNEVIAALGTRSGHLITICLPLGGTDSGSFSVEQLGLAPSAVFPASGRFDGSSAIFACCDNNLTVLTDFSKRKTKFKTKRTIWPTDLNDTSMPSPPIHSAYCLRESLSGYHNHLSLLLLAGARILLVDIWPHSGPVPRSIPLDGTPMRVIYSSTWKALVVAHLKDDRASLSFIDPDSGAVISSATDAQKQPSDYISGLGHDGDRVFGLYEWLYVKDGQSFSFIIVTTQQGRLMIVSVTASFEKTDNGRVRHLQYWTRYKKKGFHEPIYSVVGDAVGLLYCVGNVLHWEVLDLAEKKLKPMKEFTLDSPATSLRVVDTKVCALTAGHSIQVVDLHAESESAEVSLIHSDQVTRYTGHVAEMGDSESPLGKWPISIISTTQSGVAGVWIPWGQRNREFEVIFEGLVPSSVRRFRRGQTRPVWARVDRRRQFDTLLNTADGAEVLGVSLDGSLQHFSLIGMNLWRFLRLIQNLAQDSELLYPFIRNKTSDDKDSMDLDLDMEPQPFPDMMHIDGDLLQRCLRIGALKSLASVGDGMDLFCEYLDGIDDGAHTEGFREMGQTGQEKYLELGYDILEFLFEPVL